MRGKIIFIAVLFGLASFSNGETLEMRYFGFGTESESRDVAFNASDSIEKGLIEAYVVWDTSLGVGPGGGYPVQDYRFVLRDLTANPAEDVVVTPDIGGDLEFRLASGTQLKLVLSLVAFPNGGIADIDIEFTIDPGNTSFFVGMSSMPDDPEEYGSSPTMSHVSHSWTDFGPGISIVGSNSVSIFCHESPGHYTVFPHTPPSPEPCSPADMNGDGSLNFLDVSAFLSIFGKGCS